MNPAVTNLAIMLIMMQVSKKIPFDDPDVLMYVRIMYVASNVIIFGLYFYTQRVIAKKNDMTTLKYFEPASVMAGTTEDKMVTTTIKEYDSEQITKCIKSSLQGIAMMAFMHLYMKYTNPLLIQSILPLKSALEQNIVKIHLFGKPASGDLKRPFKAQSMFGPQSGPQTDKKTINEAETAGHGGAKED